MNEHDAEVITVGVNAGMAILIQAIQLCCELARLYGIDGEKLQQLIAAESELFDANTPDKLPDPIIVTVSEDDLK